MTKFLAGTARATAALRPSLALVAGSALLLSACVSGGGSSDNAGSGNLRIVVPIEPTTLEACDATLASTGVLVRSNVTEPLIERDPTTGELAPKLATEWAATGDTEWTLSLRDDVQFQDGTPFNADAAAFAIERAVNSNLGCDVEGQIFGDPDLGVEVVDDTTLKVTTEVPDPVLPLRLSFIEVGAPTDAENKVRTPIGTGPYAIGSWEPGQRITLSRNGYYWGDAPSFDTVEYQWRSEPTVRAAMVAGGEADIATGLSQDDGAGDLGVTYPNNETVALRFSGNIAPLDDIRVRRAINFAIDKAAITDSLYKDAAEPASQIVPPGVVGYNDALEPWPFNLDEASKLVAEAKADGVPTDSPITIVARTDQFPKISLLTEVLREQIARAGLNVQVKIVETSVGLQYQVRPFIEDEGAIAMLVQHGNQAGDASFSVDSYMASNGQMSMFGSSEFDAILNDASTKTADERQQAYADAFAYERDELIQFAFIARMTGEMSVADSIVYEPNSASGDELRLTDVSAAE